MAPHNLLYLVHSYWFWFGFSHLCLMPLILAQVFGPINFRHLIISHGISFVHFKCLSLDLFGFTWLSPSKSTSWHFQCLVFGSWIFGSCSSLSMQVKLIHVISLFKSFMFTQSHILGSFQSCPFKIKSKPVSIHYNPFTSQYIQGSCQFKCQIQFIQVHIRLHSRTISFINTNFHSNNHL